MCTVASHQQSRICHLRRAHPVHSARCHPPPSPTLSRVCHRRRPPTHRHHPTAHRRPTPRSPTPLPPPTPPPPLDAYSPTAYPSALAYPPDALTGVPMYRPRLRWSRVRPSLRVASSEWCGAGARAPLQLLSVGWSAPAIQVWYAAPVQDLFSCWSQSDRMAPAVCYELSSRNSTSTGRRIEGKVLAKTAGLSALMTICVDFFYRCACRLVVTVLERVERVQHLPCL